MSSFVDCGKSMRHADIQKTRRKKRHQVTTGESLVTCYHVDDNDSDKTGDGVMARGGGSETRGEPSVSQSVSAHRAAHSSLAGSPTDTMALRHRPPLVPSSTTTTCEVCTEFFFWARRVQAKVPGRVQAQCCYQ